MSYDVIGLLGSRRHRMARAYPGLQCARGLCSFSHGSCSWLVDLAILISGISLVSLGTEHCLDRDSKAILADSMEC